MRFFARMRLDTATGLQCPHATVERPCAVIADGITLSFGRRHFDVDPLARLAGAAVLKTKDKAELRVAVRLKSDRELLRRFVDGDRDVLNELEDRKLAETVRFLWQRSLSTSQATQKHGARCTC